MSRGKALLTQEHVAAFYDDLQTLQKTIPAQVRTQESGEDG
jgi:hypothetical protein